MVFNSSFMPGAFYKLYSHGLLARPPTESACLNSICLRPRHIGMERGQLSLLPPLPCGVGAGAAPHPHAMGNSTVGSIPQCRP